MLPLVSDKTDKTIHVRLESESAKVTLGGEKKKKDKTTNKKTKGPS